MPIEFTHLLSGVAVVFVTSLIFRRKLTQPIFYLWAVFVFMIPDLDHLTFWNSEMLSLIFPDKWEDLSSGLFVPRQPFLLHSWIFPIVIVIGTVFSRNRCLKWWKYLGILAIGWAIHLTIDGVKLT